MTRTAAWTGHGRVMDVSWTWSAPLYEKCGRLVARVAARADEHGKEGDEGRVAVEERLVPAEDDGGGGLEEEQRLPMPRQASEAGSAEAEARGQVCAAGVRRGCTWRGAVRDRGGCEREGLAGGRGGAHTTSSRARPFSWAKRSRSHAPGQARGASPPSFAIRGGIHVGARRMGRAPSSCPPSGGSMGCWRCSPSAAASSTACGCSPNRSNEVGERAKRRQPPHRPRAASRRRCSCSARPASFDPSSCPALRSDKASSAVIVSTRTTSTSICLSTSIASTREATECGRESGAG